MPARRAIASVDVPWSPCSPNSSSAAARISSRRSSAVFRWAVTMDQVSYHSLTTSVKVPDPSGWIAGRPGRGFPYLRTREVDAVRPAGIVQRFDDGVALRVIDDRDTGARA